MKSISHNAHCFSLTIKTYLLRVEQKLDYQRNKDFGKAFVEKQYSGRVYYSHLFLIKEQNLGKK